jgi:hypothetical protein
MHNIYVVASCYKKRKMYRILGLLSETGTIVTWQQGQWSALKLNVTANPDFMLKP